MFCVPRHNRVFSHKFLLESTAITDESVFSFITSSMFESICSNNESFLPFLNLFTTAILPNPWYGAAVSKPEWEWAATMKRTISSLLRTISRTSKLFRSLLAPCIYTVLDKSKLYRHILEIQCQLDDQELFDMLVAPWLGQILHVMSSDLVFLCYPTSYFSRSC